MLDVTVSVDSDKIREAVLGSITQLEQPTRFLPFTTRMTEALKQAAVWRVTENVNGTPTVFEERIT